LRFGISKRRVKFAIEVIYLNKIKNFVQINVKRLIIGAILVSFVLIKLKNVTLVEMLIMSIALFGGYSSLIYFVFRLRQLHIIETLEILCLVIGVAYVIMGLFEDRINNILSHCGAIKLKSILDYTRSSKFFGKICWLAILIFIALFLPLFAINLSEIVGLIMGAYAYSEPTVSQEQKQHIFMSFLIFIGMGILEGYVVLKIFDVWRKGSSK